MLTSNKSGLTRRAAIVAPMAGVAAAGGSARGSRAGTAIALNEDANHFFATRTDHRVTMKDLTDWVDQYAGTQVRELILNVNAQRTAFDSRVWTPFWKGYDPKGPDDQALFASLPEDQRKFAREWIHTAWQMNADGLDHLRVWSRRAREKGMSPWLSIRMNDLHNVDDERHPLHSDFWKAHPEYRRVAYRTEQRDKALDFGRAEVREYTFALIDEVARRYDFDGLELDWMRHGFQFRPGHETEGAALASEFMARVRRLVGRKKIGVRVPPHPETAMRLGLDAVRWAQEGTADLVTVTNYWRTVDTLMPVRLWRRILPAGCLLGAGLELGLNPFVGSKGFVKNDLESVRGAAAAYLEQGADRVYLFNYMDSQTAVDRLADYPVMLREAGSLETLEGKARRHVVTYTDTWAPGEPVRSLLPASFAAVGQWRAFRVATGPVEAGMPAMVKVTPWPEGWTVRVNGVEARAGVALPAGTLAAGECVVEVTAGGVGTVEGIEIRIG